MMIVQPHLHYLFVLFYQKRTHPCLYNRLCFSTAHTYMYTHTHTHTSRSVWEKKKTVFYNFHKLKFVELLDQFRFDIQSDKVVGLVRSQKINQKAKKIFFFINILFISNSQCKQLHTIEKYFFLLKKLVFLSSEKTFFCFLKPFASDFRFMCFINSHSPSLLGLVFINFCVALKTIVSRFE